MDHTRRRADRAFCSLQAAINSARDIYRTGKKYHMVVGVNLHNMQAFNIPDNNLVLQQDFSINKQKADNLGHSEMIDGTLAGLHHFANKGDVMFRDINQTDECALDGKKVKIYTRTIEQDEDMLIKEKYYQANPDTELYILCKIKAGKYDYLGYIDKETVDKTRKVQMIGADQSSASDYIRRIFAPQYKPMTDLIQIYEESQSDDEEDIVPQNYVPLHMHTEYSIGDGFGTLDYIAETLRKQGFKGAAITDHGTLAGTWEFQRKMLEKDLKPIIGIEAYVKFKDSEKKERFHAVLHCKNEKGWKNLKKLHALSVREHFYYKPIMFFNEILEYSEGLIITTACMQGVLNKHTSEKKYGKAQDTLNRLIENFGKENVYIEMMPHNIEDNQDTLKLLHKLSKKKGVKCIFTTDSHYPSKEDKIYHDAVKAISFKKEYGKAGYGDDCFYLMQDEDIDRKIKKDAPWMKKYIKEWKNNTFEILDKCNFHIEAPKGQVDTLPKVEFEDKSRAEKLKELCIKGLEKNTPYKYEGRIKKRLDHEINRILSKGYENYFLIVYQLIKWAKESGIMCGPGRGSVGASLAAYALNITECDPIKYDLLFDRFISEIRRDAPDIDMDFMDARRKEIFQWLKDNFGENHCAKVVTYSRFHPKGVMRDIGRIFKIPIKEIEKINSMVIERSSGDARALLSLKDTFSEFSEAKKFQEKYPLAAKIATMLEGHIRHVGIHAAAMITSDKDISEYTPIRKISGEICTEWDKKLCEDMKLVKFDILGLKTLSVIDDCTKSAGVKLPRRFDDKKVYEEIFRKGDTNGVFQFNSTGMTKFSKNLKIGQFKDLYDCTTLFRPGALQSGQATLYINRKLGKEEVEYMHPLLKPLTKDSFGCILYQEQVMQVMSDVGGMSWATAEMVRKIITKSKGTNEFNKKRADFVRNTKKLHNMPEEESQSLFDVVSTFGSYSFNKSHAVEYSIITYWTAWLKTYYPEHFYKSLLKFEKDKTKIQEYMREAEQKNIRIEYPDINKSHIGYETVDGVIYAGLDAVKGIGKKTANKIVKNRPYESIEDFKKKARIKGGKVLKGLVIADAFREFGICKKAIYEEDDSISEDYDDSEWAQLIYKHTALKPRVNLSDSYDFGDYDFGDYDFVDIGRCGEELGDQQVLLRGMVTKVVNKDKLIPPNFKDFIHEYERRMLYLNITDGTGDMAVAISPATYEQFQDVLLDIDGRPIIVLGKLTKDGNKVFGDAIQIVDKGATDGVDKILMRSVDDGLNVVTSAQPNVSKKGNSYYRIRLDDGTEGMYFRPEKKIKVGDVVSCEMDSPPFLTLCFHSQNE